MKTALSHLRYLAFLSGGLLMAQTASAAVAVWSGDSGVDTNWSTALNWTNGILPGPVNDVKFFNDGSALTNLVDITTNIGSLQYGNSNLVTIGTVILPGKTLTIASNLTVGTETDNTSLQPAQTVTAIIMGPGGTLSMTNRAATLAVRQGSATGNNAMRATLDLSGLDTFSAQISQLKVGANGPTSRPAGTLYLAMTNTITASGAVPAIQLGGDGASPGNAGNGSILYLGQTNAIFANSITVARSKQGGSGGQNCSMLFNPSVVANNPVAFFRAADGVGRVTNWFIGDSASTGGTVNATGTNDFTGGTVNALVDVMTLGKTSTATGNGTPVGTLTFSAGIFDVNTLNIAFQSIATNNNARGTVNVNGTAVLNVNTNLELGHQLTNTATATGTLNINDSGSVTVRNLYIGGGVGTVNLTNGTLTVITNLQSDHVTNSVATFNVYGGSATVNGSIELGHNNNSTATLNLNGGTLVVTNGIQLATVASSTGTLQIGGGAASVSGNIAKGAGTNTLAVNSGTLDMQPSPNIPPGNITVNTLSVGATGSGVITNASSINTTNLTVASSGAIAGATTINLLNGGVMTVNGFTLGSNQTLVGAGTDTIGGGDFTEGDGATLNPGSNNVAGTFAFGGNLTLGAGNLVLDLSNDPTQVGGANDLISVSGNLSLVGTNNVFLTALNSDFGNGTYRLISCSGMLLTGDATYFNLQGPVKQSRRNLAFSTTAEANQVDLVVSGTPAASLVWVGDGSANTWDLKTTANWNNGGSSDLFYDLDSVTFNDSGSSSPAVNLSGTLVPGSIIVSNNAKNYTFGGSGVLSGTAALTKLGTGTLTISGSGVHTFSGPITIGSGTLGYSRSDNLSVANLFTGAGTLTQQGSGALTLTGTSTNFDGAIQINSGTLVAGSSSALGDTNGATTIASGSTLDVNAQNLGGEPVIVSGSGVGGLGAIVNNNTAQQQNALQFVTLAANATFGGIGRWDIRSNPNTTTNTVLSTGGNAYKLTKVGTNQFSLVGVVVDAMLGDIDVQAGTLSAEKVTTSLGNPANTLTVFTNAVFQLFQESNVLNKVVVLQDGATFLNNSGTNIFGGPVTLQGSNTLNGAGTSLEFTNNITGPGSLNKTGNNSIILAGPNNSWIGGTVIATGALQVGDGTLNGSLPNQPITDNGNLNFNLGGGTFTFGNQILGNGGVQVLGAGTTLLTAVNSYTNATTINTTNGGALRINNANALGDLTGNTHIVGNTNGNGRLELVGGITVAEPLLVDCRQVNSINAPAVLNVSDTNTLTGTVSGTTGGSDWNFQSDSGKLTISGNFTNTATSATRNLKLMGAAVGEWSGSILNSYTNGGLASTTTLVKTNSGTWILSGNNLYTGPTVVLGGTLVVNGTIAHSASALTVSAGATLAGSGTITNDVAIMTGGTLSPGNSIGTLTAIGMLTLAGTNIMELNKSGSTLTSDLIQGLSTFTLGGTLKLVITGDPLAAGDTFTLYKSGLSGSGAFAALDPPTPGGGLAWDTNSLDSSGTLKVVSGVNQTPTNIVSHVTGNQLDLTWPTDHIGWRLQAQTNSITGGNWADVSGSTATNHVVITINPANRSVFYRMKYP